jgi:DNA mismatch endonuclease, patch repair protein
MRDTVDKATRSAIMARVRSKDTAPELRLRKALFALGLRYRLHASTLPGKPDIVLPRHRAVILVHGCLWHWHGCRRSRMPASNADYWKAKISRNASRDRNNLAALAALGWRVLIVWECALTPRMTATTVETVAAWIRGAAEPRLACIEPATAMGAATPCALLRDISPPIGD